MVEIVHEVTADVVEGLQRLLPQLSESARLPDQGEISAIIDSGATTLLVARDPAGRIVGTLTLALFPIATGVRAWIEDVIVDAEARGQGVGIAMTEKALDIARAAGAKTVDLTSRPSREAANALYRRLGFEQRDTNVYRYTL
jgi:ribosomal protein S18 acetylase RimI-like enzyme